MDPKIKELHDKMLTLEDNISDIYALRTSLYRELHDIVLKYINDNALLENREWVFKEIAPNGKYVFCSHEYNDDLINLLCFVPAYIEMKMDNGIYLVNDDGKEFLLAIDVREKPMVDVLKKFNIKDFKDQLTLHAVDLFRKLEALKDDIYYIHFMLKRGE